MVTTVLEALKENDHPYHNHGVEVKLEHIPIEVVHVLERLNCCNSADDRHAVALKNAADMIGL